MVGLASVSRQAWRDIVYVDFGRNKVYALTDIVRKWSSSTT
jgi:hypothetical protein